jgi:hypothetical protein
MTEFITATPAELGEVLRRSADTHDEHVRAAVTLLLRDGYWLTSPAFVTHAVKVTEDGAYIRWSDAKAARVRGEFSFAGSTALGLLDLALMIGANDFKFSLMNPTQAEQCAEAVANALGLCW